MKQREINRIAYTFLAVPLVINIVFRVAPLISTFWLSFTEWDVLSSPKFNGLENFIGLFFDAIFKKSFMNTIEFSFVVTFFSVVIALVLALILNEKWFFGKAFLRVIFFIPSVCSLVAVSIIWMWLYDGEYGMINYFLVALGFEAKRWLSNPRIALASLEVMTIWANIGFNMVIFLAGLQEVPNSLLEAAVIDGAGRMQQIMKIIIPILKPTTFFVVSTQFVRSFKIFGPVSVLTQGGPVNSTNVLVYYLYQNGFQWFKMGYASTISVVLLILIVTLTAIQEKVFKTDY
ncbi:MAG: carbohydrate ABC transporter permease [Sphaerochaetaceae bacterium]